MLLFKKLRRRQHADRGGDGVTHKDEATSMSNSDSGDGRPRSQSHSAAQGAQRKVARKLLHQHKHQAPAAVCSAPTSPAASPVLKRRQQKQPTSPAQRELPRIPSMEEQQDSFPYHVGECSRGEANQRLHRCRDGTFLVRKSTTDGGLVFSVIWRENPSVLGTVTHAKIVPAQKDPSLFALADVDAFVTVEELVAFYQRSPVIFAMRFWPEAEGQPIPPFHAYDKHNPGINSRHEAVRERAALAASSHGHPGSDDTAEGSSGTAHDEHKAGHRHQHSHDSHHKHKHRHEHKHNGREHHEHHDHHRRHHHHHHATDSCSDSDNNDNLRSGKHKQKRDKHKRHDKHKGKHSKDEEAEKGRRRSHSSAAELARAAHIQPPNMQVLRGDLPRPESLSGRCSAPAWAKNLRRIDFRPVVPPRSCNSTPKAAAAAKDKEDDKDPYEEAQPVSMTQEKSEANPGVTRPTPAKGHHAHAHAHAPRQNHEQPQQQHGAPEPPARKGAGTPKSSHVYESPISATPSPVPSPVPTTPTKGGTAADTLSPPPPPPPPRFARDGNMSPASRAMRSPSPSPSPLRPSAVVQTKDEHLRRDSDQYQPVNRDLYESAYQCVVPIGRATSPLSKSSTGASSEKQG